MVNSMNNNVYMIAEAGVNHNGDLNIAKELINMAKYAGADAVKFQTYIAEEVMGKDTPKADYQKQNTGSEETQYDMVKKLELSFDDFLILHQYCLDIKIDFLTTPFDFKSIDFVESNFKMKYWKIPSGEITNLPYLKKIGRISEEILLSTGMCNMDEVEDAWDILKSSGNSKITLLHCTSEYPAPLEDVNLKAIETLRHHFNAPVGYSDHTEGIVVPIAAVALGATIIEKHFTLDKTMEGPDHIASIDPYELKEMVDAIRDVETALGDGIKKVRPSELENRKLARKSIVAKKDIHAGELFSEDNITTKRPGTGLSAMCWDDIIGHISKKDVRKGDLIEL